jgi:PAS domain S-box-containing protein
LYFTLPDRRIIISTNIAIITASFLFLLPMLFNSKGYIRLARLYLCWLPPVIIMGIYVSDGMQRSHILASQYDSIYFFLIGVSALPYLLLNTSNKKELILGLSVPFLFIFFTDQIFGLFGMGHAQKGIAGDGFELNRLRAIIAYFPINACCLIMKILVESEDNKNDRLITELEEKNKQIDKQAEKEIEESENKYRLLFEQAADTIIVSREDNAIESVNPSACAMFGYTAEEFTSLKLDDIVEANDLKKSPVTIERYKNQTALYRERLLKRKDGSVFPVEINAKILPDGSLQSFVRDITDRKKAEKEIQQSESMYRLLFEQAADAIIVSKENNIIESINPSACEMFGYTAEEFASLRLEDIVDPDNLIGNPIDLGVFKNQKILYKERVLKRKDSSTFPVEINATMLPDGSLQSFIRDITARKEAEKEIQRSESRYRLLFEQAADAITIINKDKIFEQVNTSACKIFGYSEAEFLLLSLEDVLDKENLKVNPINFPQIQGGQIVRNERILKRKDGSIFPADINVKMLPDGSYQSYIRDITDRKKAENELIEAEAKFRDLVEKSSVGVYIIQQGKYQYVNPEFAKIFGYEQSELINSIPVESLAHQPYTELIRNNMRKRIEGAKETTPYEIDGVKKDGDIIRLEIFGTRTQYKGKPAIIGTLINVTENKLLQKQVLDQKVQEQKRITRAVLKAEEKERNRIGQELHDNVNQILAGTKLYLGMAAKDEFAGRGLIKSSLELVDNAIDEMRSLSKEQVTPIKGIDLKDLINSLIDKLNTSSSIKTTVTYNLNNQTIDDDLKLNIYRIIQEQMNNILKHSNALHTNISLTDDAQYLYVSIEDNGDGFDMEQKRKGIGLANMSNRIESFNGELEIHSSPGNGCQIKMSIPYLNNN